MMFASLPRQCRFFCERNDRGFAGCLPLDVEPRNSMSESDSSESAVLDSLGDARGGVLVLIEFVSIVITYLDA